MMDQADDKTPLQPIPLTVEQPGAVEEELESKGSEARLEECSGDFAVVGVGASAGGLEAFTELLTFLPADTGMSFVLVQHLDPHHESLLVELLAAKTSMPVLQVQDGMATQPDHVYVVPPNAEIVINKRVLSVHPRPKGMDQHRPIDCFFVSLASDLRSNAIGVILSGTASDGTLGLKAIKNEGGITFAQDASAKFDSMPRNAAAAGFVDAVLSPRSIAEEIAGIVKHPYRRNLELDLVENGPTLTRILALLRTHSGVDFSQYKQATLLRRMSRRIMLRKADDAVQYLRILQQEPAELQVLFDNLLINVTEFFRDPDVLLSAKRIAFPHLLSNRGASDPVRVWVPGCATGEEVYSLAIALIEFLDEHNAQSPLQMFGTDVSEAVVARARAGIYDENAMANISPERRRRFFVRVSAGYQIIQHVREQCVFSRHNVAKDPPLSRMDVISCRNLLIYLGAPLQKRVVSTFAYALRSEGTLILGTSESLGAVAEYFGVLDEKCKIYSRRANLLSAEFETANRLFSPFQPPLLPEPFSAGWDGGDGTMRGVLRQVDRLLLAQFGPSALVVDDRLRILEVRGEMKPYLKSPVSGRTELELLDAVNEDLFGELHRAVEEVRKVNNSSPFTSTLANFSDSRNPVQITVSPLVLPNLKTHYLILFEQLTEPLAEVARTGTGDTDGPEEVAGPERASSNSARRLTHLQRELAATRQYLQSIIEELRSTNEEAQSANEELQSINEELQTAKEELQSSNEELNTINAEMQSRNVELAQLNDDLINLLASMNLPVLMISGDLRIRRFTPVAEKVLHLIPSDVGRPISDLKPRINVPNLEEILRDVLDTLVVNEQEVQDFEGNWYLMRVRPYRTSDNRIQGAVLQLLDVSELKRSLEDVRHARDYAQTIVDTVREPLLVLDEELVVQNANRSFYDFFGVTEHAATGQSIRDLDQGAFRTTTLAPLLETMVAEGTRINDLELLYNHPRTGERHLVVNVRGLRSPEKHSLLLLAFEDATERKRAEEARYRRLFEAARDGIIIVDAASGLIADVNPYVEQLCGYPRKELVGRHPWELELFGETPFSEAVFERIREQGVVRFPDFVLRTQDGRTLHTEVVANCYSERNGQAIQLNIRDLTERKKFESDLQHTQKLESLGLLAGGIAHDFNNLLTGILGNASLAYSDTPEDYPTRKFMRSIMDAAERAAFLTQQMLAYAGRGRFVTRPLELGKLIREISPLIRTSIPKNVELTLDLDTAAPQVEADPGQLQQVVMNLIINAAESIPEGKIGRVEVRTSVRDLSAEDARTSYAKESLEPGPYVSMEVKDNGSGMDAETRKRVFDPFFTTKFTGRGLGLAAVQGIMRSHRGTIRVYSTPGLGSSFQVLLPVSQTSPSQAAMQEKPKAAVMKGTVLVVDDEQMIRSLAAAILSRQGYTVMTAENGFAAVEVLQRDPAAISVVVLDFLMPIMGGEETLDRLLEIRSDLPVVLCSGFDESESLERFAGKKLAGFVNKPYGAEKLLDAVNQALTRAIK